MKTKFLYGFFLNKYFETKNHNCLLQKPLVEKHLLYNLKHRPSRCLENDEYKTQEYNCNIFYYSFAIPAFMYVCVFYVLKDWSRACFGDMDCENKKQVKIKTEKLKTRVLMHMIYRCDSSRF